MVRVGAHFVVEGKYFNPNPGSKNSFLSHTSQLS